MMIPFSGQIMTGMTIVILIMGGVGYGGFKYYNGQLQSKAAEIATLTSDLSNAEEVNKKNAQTIDRLVIQNEVMQAQLGELRSRTAAAEVGQRELLKKLGEHDLSALALRKPGLIENRVNDATQKVFDDFESSTANNN